MKRGAEICMLMAQLVLAGQLAAAAQGSWAPSCSNTAGGGTHRSEKRWVRNASIIMCHCQMFCWTLSHCTLLLRWSRHYGCCYMATMWLGEDRRPSTAAAKGKHSVPYWRFAHRLVSHATLNSRSKVEQCCCPGFVHNRQTWLPPKFKSWGLNIPKYITVNEDHFKANLIWATLFKH